MQRWKHGNKSRRGRSKMARTGPVKRKEKMKRIIQKSREVGRKGRSRVGTSQKIW